MRNLPILEIRKNAKNFSEKWKNEKYEKGETHSFYDEFFRVFGNERYGIAQYEKRVDKFGKSGGYIDLFYPGVLLAEQKSAGKNLKNAKKQADDYFDLLKEEEKPRYILACDFQNFHLYDSIKNAEHEFKLSELHENVHLFEFLQNVKQEVEQYYIKVNTKVTESMGHIFTSLRHNNYGTPHVEKLLTRITFCMFAEDVGIFDGQSMFQKFIENNTSDHGGDLGEKLRTLFEILGQTRTERQEGLDEEYDQFPYINGDLFKDVIKTPICDEMIRDRIIDACKHEWTDVSPVIFGSMFQTIMSDKDRHDLGAHYTSEENILKVIRPLFMDKLWIDFKEIKEKKDRSRKKELEKFHNKLSKLTFLDPACGAGNFLIIAYREIRRLEIDVLLELRKDRVITGDASKLLSKIKVSQFYGIELSPFSVQIAQTALWMMDHKMNLELGDKFGESYLRIPLGKSPNIIIGDALNKNWSKPLPSKKYSYILGNPPFLGSTLQNPIQREQMIKISNIPDKDGTLDYVAAWFIKAAQYVNDDTSIGLVATKSITQGEQVSQLWDILFDKYGINIIFAYRPFKWITESKKAAQVTVVILGLSKKRTKQDKSLFLNIDDKIIEERHQHISPYLIGSKAPLPIVSTSSIPLDHRSPPTRWGTQPIDGGHYIFSDEQKNEFLKKEPGAEPYIRQYINARNFIRGKKQWILTLSNIGLRELKHLPEIKKRIELVKKNRLKSKREKTRELAETPTIFAHDTIPDKPFLLIPLHSSQKRKYVPMGYLSPPAIPSNATMIVQDATLGLFALLTSKMHMVWLDKVGGKLKKDYRYSAGMVYNTFPLPSDKLDSLEKHAQEILDVRENHENVTLESLYEPLTMPIDLKNAHDNLDRAVDKLYRKKPFESDYDRLKFLLEKYQKMIIAGDSGPKIGGLD